MDRRSFNHGLVAAAFAGSGANAGTGDSMPIAAVERALGGRVGVAAVDLSSGKRILHRPDERFAMCSTFKWLLAATILVRTEQGHLTLGQRVTYTAADLPSHSPITLEHVSEGSMSIEALCAAIVEESDNGAANLLLRKVGGPAAVTDFARSIGDRITRLDRTELSLNENLPGDPRDTTTPIASMSDMQRVLVDDVLQAGNRARLIGWMKACRTGLDRLRAGLPKEWIVADKTGTGTGQANTSAANDVAIAWRPGRAPVIVASYISGSSASLQVRNAAHASIGRIVAATFG